MIDSGAYTTNMNQAEILNDGVDWLRQKFGDVGTELFISLIIREKFDYTRWRRQFFGNKTVSEINERRNKAAIRIAQIYQKRYEQGDCTLIEYNTSQINLAQTQSITSEVNMQRDHYYRHLGILTGIENYQFFVDTFPDINVFSFFEQWYEPLEMNDPELQQLNNQVLSTRQQLDLSRSLWLPSVSLGYASENLANEAFRGIKVGVSIPIWSQQRSVKAANLAYQAARDEFESERIRRFTAACSTVKKAFGAMSTTSAAPFCRTSGSTKPTPLRKSSVAPPQSTALHRFPRLSCSTKHSKQEKSLLNSI